MLTVSVPLSLISAGPILKTVPITVYRVLFSVVRISPPWLVPFVMFNATSSEGVLITDTQRLSPDTKLAKLKVTFPSPGIENILLPLCFSRLVTLCAACSTTRVVSGDTPVGLTLLSEDVEMIDAEGAIRFLTGAEFETDGIDDGVLIGGGNRRRRWRDYNSSNKIKNNA
jgi:hypothetical protein